MREIINNLYTEGVKELKKSKNYTEEEKSLNMIINATIIELICKTIETELYNNGKFNQKEVNELCDFISDEHVRDYITKRIKEIEYNE